jgi:hypothetical protein
MKAIFLSLLLLSPPALSAEEAPNLLTKKVSFDGLEVSISKLFEFLGSQMQPAPNVVFKSNAGEQIIPRLLVKEVSLGNLFKVVESVADVEIELIDESPPIAPSHDPFAGGPPPVARFTSSGIIIVSSKNLALDPRPQMSAIRYARPVPTTSTPSQKKSIPEVISLAELKIPVDSLIDAIKIT